MADQTQPLATANADETMQQSKSELYRRKAGECLFHADRVTSPQDKARWLQLAESWQKLADRTGSTEEIDDLPPLGGSDATGD